MKTKLFFWSFLICAQAFSQDETFRSGDKGNAGDVIAEDIFSRASYGLEKATADKALSDEQLTALESALFDPPIKIDITDQTLATMGRVVDDPDREGYKKIMVDRKKFESTFKNRFSFDFVQWSVHEALEVVGLDTDNAISRTLRFSEADYQKWIEQQRNQDAGSPFVRQVNPLTGETRPIPLAYIKANQVYYYRSPVTKSWIQAISVPRNFEVEGLSYLFSNLDSVAPHMTMISNKRATLQWWPIAADSVLQGQFFGLAGAEANQFFIAHDSSDEAGMPLLKWAPYLQKDKVSGKSYLYAFVSGEIKADMRSATNLGWVWHDERQWQLMPRIFLDQRGMLKVKLLNDQLPPLRIFQYFSQLEAKWRSAIIVPVGPDRFERWTFDDDPTLYRANKPLFSHADAGLGALTSGLYLFGDPLNDKRYRLLDSRVMRQEDADTYMPSLVVWQNGKKRVLLDRDVSSTKFLKLHLDSKSIEEASLPLKQNQVYFSFDYYHFTWRGNYILRAADECRFPLASAVMKGKYIDDESTAVADKVFDYSENRFGYGALSNVPLFRKFESGPYSPFSSSVRFGSAGGIILKNDKVLLWRPGLSTWVLARNEFNEVQESINNYPNASLQEMIQRFGAADQTLPCEPSPYECQVFDYGGKNYSVCEYLK